MRPGDPQPVSRDGAQARGTDERLRWAYETLLSAFGRQHWWPGGGPFEVMVGAVLTQNTSWRNVEHALRAIREAGAMEPEIMCGLPPEKLQALCRPAGSWRRKAATLSRLSGIVSRSYGGLPALLGMETGRLRTTLLSVAGIGPETADAVLVYAARRPVFVVDAYARRYAERHRIVSPSASYADLQLVFESALRADHVTLGECHALLVGLGKRYCRPTPECDECPLRTDLPST